MTPVFASTRYPHWVWWFTTSDVEGLLASPKYPQGVHGGQSFGLGEGENIRYPYTPPPWLLWPSPFADVRSQLPVQLTICLDGEVSLVFDRDLLILPAFFLFLILRFWFSHSIRVMSLKMSTEPTTSRWNPFAPWVGLHSVHCISHCASARSALFHAINDHYLL